MEDKRNLHLKVQEHINCFGDSDYLQEMSEIPRDQDTSQAALKWLALAALHGINANAEKISLKKDKSGSYTVQAEYRKSGLPSPESRVGEEIMNTIRNITHIEGAKGKMPLSLGIRDSSVQLDIKIKSKEDGEKLTIEFPET
ncbi:MAG: hypothetical protein K9K79_10330 [Desulfohalobiaceae bacterium]|nr:hypothetical protein [Desulfohalobiaceae bacterium]